MKSWLRIHLSMCKKQCNTFNRASPGGESTDQQCKSFDFSLREEFSSRRGSSRETVIWCESSHKVTKDCRVQLLEDNLSEEWHDLI